MLTALIAPVPEAAAAVAGWLERTVGAKPSTGIPPHVTVIFPFAPAEEVEYHLLDELAELVARHEPFDVAFAGFGRFPTALYLEPDPHEPFVRLTEAVVERWPQWPPYGGEFEAIVPHLTVAQGEPALLDSAEADVAPKLPLATRVTELVLFEEVEPFMQRWEPRQRFQLGARR